MAIMIPIKPKHFEKASLEDVMFDALKSLPDEYYVFHSFKIGTVYDNTFYESETDFLIFNKNLGILCLEAKAGQIRYENGSWLYASGKEMSGDGPFSQASSNKWKLKNLIEKRKLELVLKKCKLMHGVWFPSISNEKLRQMTLPADCDKRLILTSEAISEPKEYIEKIFGIELPNRIKTDLNDTDTKLLIKNVLCPSFNIFPSASFDKDIKELVFNRLLKEQTAILNFLSEQKTAVINGAAGTGKTVIAVEKARRHAENGEKVLFLCYNRNLNNHLRNTYFHQNISFNSIYEFACNYCGTSIADFNLLKDKLEDAYISGNFPYRHIIIDEGQDFGLEDIEEAEVLSVLKDIISEIPGGTFYIFYDKLQLIQAKIVPEYISDSDCKLTLYRNCRNTENIAITSLKPVSERVPILHEDCIKGVPAKLHFCENNSIEKCVDNIIESLKIKAYKDIIILTVKSEENSTLGNFVKNGIYKNKIRFSTCRKFKGLEAEAVILIDVDNEVFEEENIMRYYVGTSRARLNLDIVSVLSIDDCTNILKSVFKISGEPKKPQKELARALNAQVFITE